MYEYPLSSYEERIFSYTNTKVDTMITLNMIEAMTEYEVIVDAFKEYAESISQQTPSCQVTIKESK
jgi:hypothetical protein